MERNTKKMKHTGIVRKIISYMLIMVITVSFSPDGFTLSKAGLSEVDVTSSLSFGAVQYGTEKEVDLLIDNSSGAEDIQVYTESGIWPDWFRVENDWKTISAGTMDYISIYIDGTKLYESAKSEGKGMDNDMSFDLPVGINILDENGDPMYEGGFKGVTVTASTARADAKATFTMDDFEYGNPSNPEIFYDGDPDASYVVELTDRSDGSWTAYNSLAEFMEVAKTLKVSDAGYGVRIMYNASEHYSAVSTDSNFTVYVKPISLDFEITMPEKIYLGMEVPAPVIVPNKELGDYTVDDICNYYFSLKSGGPDCGIPYDEGTYYCNVSITDSRFKNISKSVKFKIVRIPLSVSVKDVEYGVAVTPVLTGGEIVSNTEIIIKNLPLDLFDIYYKKQGGNFTKEKPSEIGDYEVKVTDSDNLYEAATTTFKILPLPGDGSIYISDVVYPNKINPRLESTKNGVDACTVYYKEENADDSAYTLEKPVYPGTYIAKAVFAAHAQYKEFVAETRFVISKAEGKGDVSISSPYLGEKLNPRLTSENYDVNEVAIYYKKVNQPDLAYTLEKPTTVGSYIMKVVFLTNRCYKESQVTVPFVIDYMPTPEFRFDGTLGSNEFYTSDVVIRAPRGYLISTSLDGTFGTSVMISENNPVKEVYFKNAVTGGLTSGIKVDSIKVDTTMPNITGAADNDVLVGNEAAVVISDKNLAQVKVNGNVYDFNGNSADIRLGSNDETATYTIEATDLGGNTVTYTITVEAEWYSRGIVPMGREIQLRNSKAYKTGEKECKIDGDDTVYASGVQFYVKSEGKYTFTEQ